MTALERGRVDSSVSAIIHRLVAKVEDLGRRNDRSDCIKQLSTEFNSWRAKYDQCVHVSSTCTQAANAAMQLSQGTKDIVTELGQRVKIVADRMISIGDALNERASYDDVARSTTQVQTVFESLSDRVTGLIARVDMIERSLVESQSNHPAIGGVNLKIEDLSTRVCQIDRMMQDVEQRWTNNRDGIKWVKDQLYETQANLEMKSRDCKSYTDRQNTHNMAVSTTLNSKLEQMLEVLGNTAQRSNSLESRHSNQASSSGLNDHTGGRRATSRTPDKRPPPPGPPDGDPPPPPPPDWQSPGGGGKKSAAGGNPGDPGKPRCKYVGDGYNHLMAEFHCKGCRGDICEYCFSFKENLCEECSRNGPRCGVCRESSFLTKGIECQFCKTYYCTRHSSRMCIINR